MATLHPIVLCDHEGDELRPRKSVVGQPAPASCPPASGVARAGAAPHVDEDEEPIPETLRSPVSASQPVSRPIIVEDAGITAA